MARIDSPAQRQGTPADEQNERQRHRADKRAAQPGKDQDDEETGEKGHRSQEALSVVGHRIDAGTEGAATHKDEPGKERQDQSGDAVIGES